MKLPEGWKTRRINEMKFDRASSAIDGINRKHRGDTGQA
jgi:hypothetical protein